MRMTITEKILARAAGRDNVRPGEFLDCKVDQVSTMDVQGRLVLSTLQKLGVTRLPRPDRFAIVLDHLAPAPTVAMADIHAQIRAEAARLGVGHFMDVGSGIMHVVLPERGLVLPGELVIMNESHTPTGGALGAAVIGVGQTDAAVAIALGETWLVVPETIRVELTGTLAPRVTAKDLGLHLMHLFGFEREAIYRTLEFGGPGLAGLGMEQRFTITNFCSDMGAKSAIMEADEVTLAYITPRAQRPFTPVKADPGCRYLRTVPIALDALEPLVSGPHVVDHVVKASELAGTRVDQAMIGTCTNGRLSDIAAAAQILSGRRIAPGVRLIVTPASREAYQGAMRAGHLDTLIEAGAVVTAPGCGACNGDQSGVLGAGEVCISSGNRNSRGRMGSSESTVFLASPETVAASAVAGQIIDPRAI